MSVIRVLLADEHATIRQGLKLLCSTQADLAVVAEASTASEAVRRIEAMRPHVVILDVSPPAVDWLAAAMSILEASPRIGIIAWSCDSDSASVTTATAAGIRGYVLKQSDSAELFRAVRAVGIGDVYLDSHLTADRSAIVDVRLNGGKAERLSDREASVLRLAAVGYGNKRVASDLGISVKTVEAHKWNAMRKLRLTSRVEVLSYAILRGWLANMPKASPESVKEQ